MEKYSMQIEKKTKQKDGVATRIRPNKTLKQRP